MGGVTAVGVMHVAFSLGAVVYGVLALLRNGMISSDEQFGQFYLVATMLTCMTAFGLFRHAGLTTGHWLALLTLAMVFGAAVVGKSKILGGASLYVETIGYSATLLFHLISGAAEIATRLPLGAPLASSPLAPGLLMFNGALVLLFVLISALQVRMLSHGAD